MARTNFDEVDKITKNRYEAVLIAAQRARQINSLRLALLERMAEEDVDIDGRKVTSIAMQDLANGKVEFVRKGEPEE
jgi:DNA-directed RNA polymerase omega subunit